MIYSLRFCLSGKFFIYLSLGRRALQGKVFTVFFFFSFQYFEYIITLPWPVMFLLINPMIALWVFPCKLQVSFLLTTFKIFCFKFWQIFFLNNIFWRGSLQVECVWLPISFMNLDFNSPQICKVLSHYFKISFLILSPFLLLLKFSNLQLFLLMAFHRSLQLSYLFFILFLLISSEWIILMVLSSNSLILFFPLICSSVHASISFFISFIVFISSRIFLVLFLRFLSLC